MSSIQAQNIRAPFDGNIPSGSDQNSPTNNNYQVLLFTAGVSGTETTSAANALPRGWAGKWVTMYASGGAAAGTVTFGFSKNSAAVVDNTVTATQAGVGASVGGVITNDNSVQNRLRIRLPYIKDNEILYFVRQSSQTATKVWLELSSD